MDPTYYWIIAALVLMGAGLFLARTKTAHWQRLMGVVALVLLGGEIVRDPAKFILGPDLRGGTILIYGVNSEGATAGVNIEKLLPTLKERLDPAGLKNFTIRGIGQDRVEIIMPGGEAADVDDVKRLVSTVGQLQFRIVADRKRKEHVDLMEDAERAWPNRIVGPVEAPTGVFVRYGTWLPLDKDSEAELATKAKDVWPDRVVAENVRFVPTSEIPPDRAADLKKYVVETADDGRTFVLARWDSDEVGGIDGFADRPVGNRTDARKPENFVRVDDDGNHYVLLVVDSYDVTGRYLTRVEPTVHQGKPGISFSFDAKGASKFYRLTSDYQKEPDGYKHMLGVVLDNRLRSAPTLDERISGNGVISGSFTQVEVEALKKILTAGQLPYALNKEPETQFQIGPTLGRDTINAGLFCIALSLVSVLAFIVYYYRVAGMVAVVALLMNLLFTIALLVLFKATWTLPGLAGLVLTVGMSVDANVLIFERIREELENNSTLKAALRTGYEKAWTTIFDSNLTTVITALVLYAIGTDQVKGFAITLIIGLATGIFCAVS
ncbi:MAG: protein translocase subunit SecD, partial [Planctomycetia bacterium]